MDFPPTLHVSIMIYKALGHPYFETSPICFPKNHQFPQDVFPEQVCIMIIMYTYIYIYIFIYLFISPYVLYIFPMRGTQVTGAPQRLAMDAWR